MPGFYGSARTIQASIKPFLQHFWQVEGSILGFLNLDSPLILLQDFKLPTAEIEQFEKEGASIYYKYAKFAKYGDATATFYDLQGLLGQLEEWRKKIWSPDKGIRPKKEYVQDVKILQTNGEGVKKRTYTLFNCWPRTIDHGPLSYERSEARIVTVTFACDYYEAIENG